MKRLITLIFAILICLCFTACKSDETSSNENFNKAEVEHEIRVLMEKNLDCYYMFYVSPINHTAQQNSDGYYGTDGAYFADYAALESLVTATYTSEKAYELLNYPSTETPLYKNVDGKIFVLPSAIEPVEYNILWDDTYTVEFLEASTEKCTFKLTTTDFDGMEYLTEGSAVNVDGKWLFEDLVY